jgi:flagella basal body P-ring formation protein FlgA
MMPRNFFLKYGLLERGFQKPERSGPRSLLRYLGSFWLLAAFIAPAQAADNLQANQQIRQAVDQFMTAHVEKLKSRLGPKTRVEYNVGSLDNRLAVSVCGQPLVVETRDTPQPNTRLNLQVSCQQANNWSIYLPVELAIYRPAVVAVNSLTHGDTIGPADVRLVEVNVSQVNGQYLNSLDDAIGKDVKRSIPAGAAIADQQLVAPLMVRRGEAVLINANSNIVAVKVSGIALTDGRLGEQIRIKNQTSSRVVNARITGPGQAEVSM